MREAAAHALSASSLRPGPCAYHARIPCAIVLHAIWSHDSQLGIWGEDAALPARAPKRRGRVPEKPRPRAHPFACPVEELQRATSPFILRRLKTDKRIISDLPEKIEMRVDCHLPKEQATLYQVSGGR